MKRTAIILLLAALLSGQTRLRFNTQVDPGYMDSAPGTCYTVVTDASGFRHLQAVLSGSLTAPPTAPGSCTVPGQWATDAARLYVCTAALVWASAPLVTTW